MSDRRAVVTGLGVVSSLGLDPETFFAALCEGRSGIGPITLFDASRHPVRFAGEVPGWEPLRFLEHSEAKRLDRFAQFAVVAADFALKDSGLDLAAEDPNRVGAIVGSGIGGMWEFEEAARRITDRGPERLSPFTIPKIMLNAASGQIAIRYGLRGPNYAVASACAASNHAIGLALQTVRQGLADVVVTGGSEAAVSPLGVGAFAAMKALSRRNDDPTRASRPFDRERDGFVLGEGGGILVIEEEGRARARGARIYCELAGFGMSDDGHHITAPHPEGDGALRAMRLALVDAAARPEDIDYVNAHGTSTPAGDPIEVVALRRLLGDRAPKVPVSSTKSMIGHLLGASGGVEAVAVCLSLAKGVIHPTANHEEADADCAGLDYVPGAARDAAIGTALSNSFGFGGHNATLVFRRCGEGRAA